MLVAAGQYRLYGQDLNIERGGLIFSGGPVNNPGLDLRVSRRTEDVTVGAKVSGTLKNPLLRLFSEPAMPGNSMMSYLLFGHPPGSDTMTSAEQERLLKAASSLFVMGGNVLADKLSETPIIDDIGVEAGNSFNDASDFIGKYLSP